MTLVVEFDSETNGGKSKTVFAVGRGRGWFGVDDHGNGSGRSGDAGGESSKDLLSIGSFGGGYSVNWDLELFR